MAKFASAKGTVLIFHPAWKDLNFKLFDLLYPVFSSLAMGTEPAAKMPFFTRIYLLTLSLRKKNYELNNQLLTFTLKKMEGGGGYSNISIHKKKFYK